MRQLDAATESHKTGFRASGRRIFSRRTKTSGSSSTPLLTIDRARLLQLRERLDALLATVNRR
jgi:hypothetical protein